MNYFLIFTLSLLIWSCKKNSTFESKSHALEGFHSVTLNESFDVSLKEADSFYLEITGSQKSLIGVRYSIKDSILTIENKTKNKWLHPKSNKVNLIVYCPQLKFVLANKTCFIHTLNPITTKEFGLVVGDKLNMANIEVNNETCYVWNKRPTGGDFVFRGKTENFKVWVNSLMRIDGFELQHKYALVENESKNDVMVAPTDLLEYAIRGKGNIRLKGVNPAIIKLEDTDKGELIYE